MVKSNVNVYIGGESVEISAYNCGVALNPIVLLIGRDTDTSAVRVLMRRDQAEGMARAILAQLQGDDEQESATAQVAVDMV